MVAKADLVARLTRAYALDPQATLGTLARRAGISRATLHRSFGTREDLLVAMLHGALDVLEAAATTEPQELRSLVVGLGRHGPHVVVLQREERLLASNADLAARSANLLQQITRATDGAVQRGELADAPREFLARVVVDVLWSVWTATEAGELDTAGDWAWRIISRGLAPVGSDA